MANTYEVPIGGRTVTLESEKELSPTEQQAYALRMLGESGQGGVPGATGPYARPGPLPIGAYAGNVAAAQDPQGRVESAPLQERAYEQAGGLGTSVVEGVKRLGHHLDLDTPGGALRGLLIAAASGGGGVIGRAGGAAVAPSLPSIAGNVGAIRAYGGAALRHLLPFAGEITGSAAGGAGGGRVAQELPGGTPGGTLRGAEQGAIQGVLGPLARRLAGGATSLGQRLGLVERPVATSELEQAGSAGAKSMDAYLTANAERAAVEKAQQAAARTHLTEVAKIREARAIRNVERQVVQEATGLVSNRFGVPIDTHAKLEDVLLGEPGREIAQSAYRKGLQQIGDLVPIRISRDVPSQVLNPITGQPFQRTQNVSLKQAFEELSDLGHQAYGIKGLGQEKKEAAIDLYKATRDSLAKTLERESPQAKQIFDEIQGQYRERMALRDYAEKAGFLSGNTFDPTKAQTGLSDGGTLSMLQRRFGPEGVEDLRRIFRAGTGEGPGFTLSNPIVP